MPLIEKHIHVHHHILLRADDPVVQSIIARLAGVANRQEKIMLDTTKILAAVAAERTESASLRGLLAANTQALKDASAQIASLQAQLQSGTVITADQLAAIQTDLDNAAADLSTDNDAAVQAIAANTIPPANPVTPPSADQSQTSNASVANQPAPAPDAPQGDQAAPQAAPAPITTDAPQS